MMWIFLKGFATSLLPFFIVFVARSLTNAVSEISDA